MRTLSTVFVPAAIVLAILLHGVPATAQCVAQWDTFAPSGIGNGTIYTTALDTTVPAAPRLYVAGEFDTLGGTTAAAKVGCWDGHQWSAVGTGVGGVTYPTVLASAMFDDDGPGPHAPALFVGGNFATAGGVGANSIAKWDGANWSALGAGVDSWVYSLCVFDDDGAGPHLPALYAGGFFLNAGGAPASGIAKWNGSSWSALGSGVTNSPYLAVYSMTTFDDDGPGPHATALYVGGTFGTAGGVPALNIAKWNGSSWSALGGGIGVSGTTAYVRSMCVHDEDGSGPGLPALSVGGWFDQAGGAPAGAVARWNGTTWAALGGGMNNFVEGLSSFDDDGPGPHATALYASGSFWIADGQTANGLAKWNGAAWTEVGGGFPIGGARTSVVLDADGPGPQRSRLIVAGNFMQVGNMSTTSANRLAIASWDGTAWAALGAGGGLGGGSYDGTSYEHPAHARSMATFDEDGLGPNPPRLFVAGNFSTVGNVPVPYFARWDGAHWSAVGLGQGFPNYPTSTVAALDVDGPGPGTTALYVGGDFGVWKWDGISWSQFGPSISGTVMDLAVFDDDGPGPHPSALYAAGYFYSASFPYGERVLKFDGNSWTPLGGGVSSSFSTPPTAAALAVYDDDGPGPILPALYVGGYFNWADFSGVANIARWDGTSWTSPGSGVQYSVYGNVRSLLVVDEDGAGPARPYLYVGGSFTNAGGNSASGVARWDGAQWSVPSGLGVGAGNWVNALSLFDEDGAGPALPVVYLGADSISQNVYRWDFNTLTTLPAGGVYGPNGGNGYAYVNTLLAFDDDGAGPDPETLYLGGNFSWCGALRTENLARWVACGSSISSFCPGDGSAGSCPCGNFGFSGRGCENSASFLGAQISGAGDTSLDGDSLVLTSTEEPSTAPTIFLQGSATIAPVPFGDGLRCIGGSLLRLYTKIASGGVVAAPQPGDLRIAARSAELGDPLVGGVVRHYQAWYRDPNPGFCPTPTGNTFNITNGLKVVWGP